MSGPSLTTLYPWTSFPFIISAPTRPFATSPLATAVSLASGLGFLSFIPDDDNAQTGTSYDLHASHAPLSALPRSSSAPSVLPLGIGYLIHSAPFSLGTQQIREHRPAVVWLFAPTSLPLANSEGTLRAWSEMIRRESPETEVWVQVGSVAGALHAIEECGADITLVVQGTDAGGHGLKYGAGIVSLLPEVKDTLAEKGYGEIRLMAAGGIADARGAAAALMLGADGVVMGTRFLASHEAAVPAGFRESVLAGSDGGQSTFRTSVFDRLRGTKLGGDDGKGWPEGYGGRGVRNVSSKEIEEGKEFGEVKEKFDEAVGKGEMGRFGKEGRDVTYVGTGVGLVKEVKGAGDIVREVREGVGKVLEETRQRLGIM